MCFFWFWLFSAVFLCGQFQYDVSNRWNSAVFMFSTVFVWTIPVCAIITKGNSVIVACELLFKCPPNGRAAVQRVTLKLRLVSYHGGDLKTK